MHFIGSCLKIERKKPAGGYIVPKCYKHRQHLHETLNNLQPEKLKVCKNLSLKTHHDFFFSLYNAEII